MHLQDIAYPARSACNLPAFEFKNLFLQDAEVFISVSPIKLQPVSSELEMVHTFLPSTTIRNMRTQRSVRHRESVPELDEQC